MDEDNLSPDQSETLHWARAHNSNAAESSRSIVREAVPGVPVHPSTTDGRHRNVTGTTDVKLEPLSSWSGWDFNSALRSRANYKHWALQCPPADVALSPDLLSYTDGVPKSCELCFFCSVICSSQQSLPRPQKNH